MSLGRGGGTVAKNTVLCCGVIDKRAMPWIEQSGPFPAAASADAASVTAVSVLQSLLSLHILVRPPMLQPDPAGMLTFFLVTGGSIWLFMGKCFLALPIPSPSRLLPFHPFLPIYFYFPSVLYCYFLILFFFRC